MLRRSAGSLIALTILALPARAQSLADAKTCDQAITGSATAKAAIQRLAGVRATTPVAHFAAGCLAVMETRWDSAAAHFDAAATGNPRSSAAFYWIGNIAGQRARMAPGMDAKVRLAPLIRDSYAKAIDLDGANLDAREALMQFLLEAPPVLGGDRTKAGEQAAAISRLSAFRGLSAEIAVASAKQDRPAVEKLLTQATAQFPDSVLGWANLSAIQADAQRPADAFATITRWQARRTHANFALFSLGRTAAVTGQQLDRGAQALLQYLRTPRGPNDPPLANAHYRLAQIYEKQNRKADARAEYTTALGLNSNLRDARMALDRLR